MSYVNRKPCLRQCGVARTAGKIGFCGGSDRAMLSWMYLNDLEGFTQEAAAADTEFIPVF